MLRHVALFRWKPEVTAEDVSRIEEGLRSLPAAIPCIRSYRFGRDLGLQEGNADFGVVADFVDEEGLRTYAEHPAHLAVLTERIRPHIARREAIQYVIGDSD
ncbi:MAG TPA: Dabb family protein [Candidatus Limnocylindrales bacterium]|nr:Dabb family protein [Candidatus Limnocylindrales bacterium]